MSKRLQISLTDEAWKMVEQMTADAAVNFEVGSINYSDVINEMILTSKVDVKTLQTKHTNLRRSLRIMATQKDLDIEAVIKTLNDLKGKCKKEMKPLSRQEVFE